MSSFPEPHGFQLRALESLREGIRAGHKNQCIMAPTGAGKTYIGMSLIDKALAKGKRCAFLCDRVTLIHQTSAVAHQYGLGCHGIIQADNPRLNLQKQFQIASVQTLARRGWPEFDLIIVDECHTLYKTWVEYVVSPECTARVVGLSATPFSKGMAHTFTNLVNAATMHDLTQLGVLVPMRIFSCRQPDMAGAEVLGGEWSDRAAEERELVLIGDVVSEWQTHAESRKTIVFGATIRHCEELVRQFNEAGIPAATYTADTTESERADLLADYRQKDSYLRVLVSVEALAKGFDVPDVGCVVDARPLRKSLSTAIQMWGRGLRSSKETGKEDCLLLDFSGNIIRFLRDYEEIFHNGLDRLDDGEKLDRTVREDDQDHEPAPCPRCGHIPFGQKCMACGYEAPKRAIQEALPGRMQEVVLNGKKLAENHADLWAQVCTYAKAGHSPDPERQRKRALALFKNITGEWPMRHWDFFTAPTVAPSRHTLNKIRSLNIAFAHRRAS